jgi:DNA primase large subunit
LKFGSDDLAKYSFLPQAGEFIRLQGISVSDLAGGEYQNVLDRAEERVVQAIKNLKVTPKIEDRELEIMSFPVALMLVKSTNLEHVMSRYALAEAMRAELLMKEEKDPKVIEELFRNSIGLELEHSSSPSLPPFRIPISEYLKRASKFHKTEWKLVNKVVGGGKVYLSQEDLIRLIREEIRIMILDRLKEVRLPKLPENLQAMVKKIVDIAPPPPQSPYTIIHISPENYPPCVRKAIDLLDAGENVPHYGRFLMATYLLGVGKSVDDIVSMFPKAPDFKQNVTRYQVEHLAGLKGSKTRYRVPSCKTLQTHQFCFMDPVKCYQISNPLQYPSRFIPPSADKKPSGKGEGRPGRVKSTVSGANETAEKGRSKRGWMKNQRR